MTIKKDPSLEEGSPKNHQYFKQKWGGSPGKEKFLVPFNDYTKTNESYE